MANLDISGIHIPTATPFNGAGEVDLDAFRTNAKWGLSAGVQGLVVGGSTGEAVLLDESERTALLAAAREELGDRLLIAGTGAESTRATLRLSRAAADAGADALLVQPPAFYRGAMSVSALDTHFRTLAEASTIPVILYQVPLKLSTLDLDNDWIAEISSHPNVIGIKDSRGKLDLVELLVGNCVDDFQILVGNGAILKDALDAGAAGGILGVANLLPAECVEVFRAQRAGDDARATAVQATVAPVHVGIIANMGVPGVKYALDQLGLRGGDPRPPLHPLAEDRRGDARTLLKAAGAHPGD